MIKFPNQETEVELGVPKGEIYNISSHDTTYPNYVFPAYEGNPTYKLKLGLHLRALRSNHVRCIFQFVRFLTFFQLGGKPLISFERYPI